MLIHFGRNFDLSFPKLLRRLPAQQFRNISLDIASEAYYILW
jgi:hypothetical protein